MTTLYERVGGQDGITRIVDAFYRRVLDDPELAPLFASASIERLRRMQWEFFGAALDGPVEYTGTGLTDAHAHLHLSSADFSRFTGHLLDTLTDLGFDDEVVQGVVARLSLYADDIVGGHGEEG